MTKQYIFVGPEIRIHEILKVPKDQYTFLHDVSQKEHWGPMLYQLYCPKGIVVTYDNPADSEGESLFVDLRGTKVSKLGDVYFGNTYCIVNRAGAYVCVYCVKSGNIYTHEKDIHILFHAQQMHDREPADQLAQFFIPETMNITEKDNISTIK